jgi:amidase
VEQVASRAADAGARAAERLPEVDWDAQDALFRDLVGALTGAFDPQAGLQPEQRTLAWYLEALDRRDRLGQVWEAFFEDVDALLVPAAPTTAFTHRETGAPLEVDRQAVSYWEAGRLVAFVNLAGLPALSVPTGPGADGLPIGLQLVGPRWSEPRLLEIAQELERAGVLPGFRPPPSA